MLGQIYRFFVKKPSYQNINNINSNVKEDQFFKYVSRNQTLKDIRGNIEETDDGKVLLNELLQALKSKDGNADIFSHDYALMLTQILFEKSLISDEERLTVFQYLTTLRTYTDKQALQEGDDDLKVICDVELLTPNHPKYKSYLYQYFGNIFSSLSSGIIRERKRQDFSIVVDESKRFNFSIDKAIDSMRTMRYFEDCLIVVYPPRNGQTDHISYESLLEFGSWSTTNNAFYLENDKVVILPSISVFKSIQNQINPDFCFEHSPMLGWVRPETLFNNFHKNKSHAISVYSNHIKSNPPSVHSLRGGPAYVMLHDLFHIRMVSLMFSDNMYKFYTNELVPFSVQFQKSFCKINNIEIKKLDDFVEFTNDYLLANVDDYRKTLNRCFDEALKFSNENKHREVAGSFLIVAFENLNQKFLESHNLQPFERPKEWLNNESSDIIIDIKNNNFIMPCFLSDWDDNRLCSLLERIKESINNQGAAPQVNYLPFYGNINNINNCIEYTSATNNTKKRKVDYTDNDAGSHKKTKL